MSEVVSEVKETKVVELQAEVKTPAVNTATNTVEVKVEAPIEAPKNRLIDGAVDALNKKLDFRV